MFINHGTVAYDILVTIEVFISRPSLNPLSISSRLICTQAFVPIKSLAYRPIFTDNMHSPSYLTFPILYKVDDDYVSDILSSILETILKSK